MKKSKCPRKFISPYSSKTQTTLINVDSLFSNEKQEVPFDEKVKMSKEVVKSLFLENSEKDPALIDIDSLFSNEK